MMSASGSENRGQRHEDGTSYIGVDGLLFDVSNLSTGGREAPSSKTTHGLRTNLERPNIKLYPSLGSIRLLAPSVRPVGLIFEELNSLEAINVPRSGGMDSKEDLSRVQVQRQFKEEPFPENFSTGTKDSNPKNHHPANSPPNTSPQNMSAARVEKLIRPRGLRSSLSSISLHFSQVTVKPGVRETKERFPDAAGSSGSHAVNIRPPPSKFIEIEVSPGVFLPMRGAEETERAVRCGNINQTTCACCEALLYCINAAEFLYCPVCRIIGPVASSEEGRSDTVGGVGLGLTEDAMHDIMVKIKH